MTSSRLEAFSDGVIAIIITIMVLDLKAPNEYTLVGFYEVVPKFIGYFVSFLYVSIYWVNHHQLFKIVEKIDGKVLWVNLLLLFWLSLIPFSTSWIGEGNHHTDITPVLLYGFILLMSQLSFMLLRSYIIKIHGKESKVSEMLSKKTIDFSCAFVCLAGIFLSFMNTYISMGLFLSAGFLKVLKLRNFSKNSFV